MIRRASVRVDVAGDRNRTSSALQRHVRHFFDLLARHHAPDRYPAALTDQMTPILAHTFSLTHARRICDAARDRIEPGALSQDRCSVLVCAA